MEPHQQYRHHGRGYSRNRGAIHDPNVSGLPQPNQQTLNNSIWWQWTAPTTGPITVDTLGSALANTVLAVYTGGSVNSLNQIAFNDNISSSERRSRVTFNAIAGLTYYFAVDGVGNTTGAVQLNLNTAPQITPNQSFSVLENAPAGTPLGTLTANESGLTWSIVSGNPDNDSDGDRAFTINASTGAILVNDAATWTLKPLPLPIAWWSEPPTAAGFLPSKPLPSTW
ncbi:MAG: cadherin repeat domain-containing protein [Leptolyngbyaceae cyanobacterium SM2_5_2]|nr:cadherin repeat domain-containing protein [Leptolyngbyaceae cyanobacterium SM2_5_2]